MADGSGYQHTQKSMEVDFLCGSRCADQAERREALYRTYEAVSYTHLDVYKRQIIAHLGTQVFPRIKVGVGEKPKKYDLADYVLSHFTKAEREEMEEGYQKAIQAVEKILAGEMEAAMNEFNRKVKPKEA